MTTGPSGGAALLDVAGLATGRPRPSAVALVRAALDADDGGGHRAAAALPVDEMLPALVAAVPAARARHLSLGLPDDVSRATLADVGRKVRAYGAAVDIGWLLGLLRGDVVAVGRLQAERRVGPHGRELHVPEGPGLDRAAVDDAVRRADVLLGAAPATCCTWLLDPWLAEVLPATSGVVRFATAFDVEPADATPAGGPATSGDRAVARFVLRRPLEEVLAGDVPAGPRPTSLQRLLLERLRAGGHVREARGTHRPAAG